MVHSLAQPDIRISSLKIDISLFPYLAFLAFLGTTISTFKSFNHLREFLLFACVKVLAFTVLYFFWSLMVRVLKSRDKSVLKIWQVMLVGAIGGLFFSLGEEAAIWIFTYPLNVDFLPRAFSHVVAGSFWLPAASVVSRNLKRYKRLRDEVREKFLEQESVRLARGLALEEYRRQIESQIQEKLEVTSKEASMLLKELKNSKSRRIPEYLRVISTEYFSLLGRSLSQDNLQKAIGVSRLKAQVSILLKTLQESIETRPLNPLWFATMVTSTILQHLLQRFDFLGVIEVTAIIFISVYSIQKLQVVCIRYCRVRQILVTSIFTLITIALPLTIVHLFVPDQEQISRFGAFGVLILAVTVFGHFAQAGLLRFMDFRLESVSSLSKIRIDEREVNLLFLQITKDWASHIHGSITSKLESAAIEIENALEEEDYEAITKAIERVSLYLKSESTIRTSSEKILLDEVNEKIRGWDGLIKIQVISNISREETVNVLIRDVGACIEEAILNATRHGDCSSMTVEIIDTQSTFRIVCSDNGVGFLEIPKGFGTKIFDQATRGKWSLIRDTSSALTILTLDFPKL